MPKPLLPERGSGCRANVISWTGEAGICAGGGACASGLESGFEGAGQSRHPGGPVPAEETQPREPWGSHLATGALQSLSGKLTGHPLPAGSWLRCRGHCGKAGVHRSVVTAVTALSPRCHAGIAAADPPGRTSKAQLSSEAAVLGARGWPVRHLSPVLVA